MKCEECGDTGIIAPTVELSIEELQSCKYSEYVMECDYCEAIPNFELYEKYIDNLIKEKALKEN